jgi:uncharacterized membrane protein YjjP (DUF1212 family)
LAGEAHAIVRTGKALLSSGAETYRVRLSMEQVAAAIGIQWLQSHVTLSEVTVTLFKGATFRTQVGNVHSVGVNGDKLSQLELMTAELPPDSTPAQVEERLDAIDARQKLYPAWLQALVAAVACTAVAFLTNAWAVEILGVFTGAFLGQFLKAQCSKLRLNVYATTLTAALVAAFVYLGMTDLLSWLVSDTSAHGAGFVPALIFLVPGFPLVTALLDLVKTDMTAGLSRLAYAFMILGSASAALLVTSWFGGVSAEPLPPPPIPEALWWVLALVASGVGVAGWSIMFNVSRRGAVLAGIVGLAGNAARLILLDVVHVPAWAAAATGCFVIGLLATVLADRHRLAAVTLCVPAALIMVPGAVAYRALVHFSRGNVSAMMSSSALAIFTIIGMAIGLSLARILSDKSWILDQRRTLGT